MCTDSRYAFATAHVHGAIYRERGLLTSEGKAVKKQRNPQTPGHSGCPSNLQLYITQDIKKVTHLKQWETEQQTALLKRQHLVN